MSGKRVVVGLLLAAALALGLVATAAAQDEDAPSVTVVDQAIVNGQVTIPVVRSPGMGWLVIHADADGRPGPILGYSQVMAGDNADVLVVIDATQATDTLYAMLHTDAGEEGTFEFPGGPDTPVSVEGEVVSPPFAVTAGVGVADQPIEDGAVTIARVFSEGPGWLVIHADADGGPGPILGFSPVEPGRNDDVLVEIDVEGATETLYAMLHVDAGEEGTFEFPGGADGPVIAEGMVITPPFTVTGGLEPVLPETGGAYIVWLALALVGLAAVLVLVGLRAQRQSIR